MDILQGLNQQQREAVESGDGPVLIVAGPGTGKTKTLSARIAYLVGTGVDPSRILALTFTVKAAREMQERVATLLEEGEVPTISTFHSLGYQVLRQAQPDQELTFISEADRLSLIRELSRPNDLTSLSVRELALLISRQKGAVAPNQSGPLATILSRYQAALEDKSLVDYDDLLYRAHQYLIQRDEARQAWQARYDFILIDEFQDTSELQWELIGLIRGNDNVFVIGDPKQSIYGFRGASAQMFDRFRQDFPTHREVTLEVNYRSDASIVALANAVFPQEAPLLANATTLGEVQTIQTLNEYSEADFVLEQIERGIGGSDLLKASSESKGRGLRDFSVLYRTHHVAKTLQRRLHDSGIPFQVVGEGSPYEQPGVQAVIGALRWFANGELPEVKGFSSAQLQTLLGTIQKDQPVSKLAEAIAEALGQKAESAARQRVSQFVSTLVRYDTHNDGLRACLEHIDRIAQSDFYDREAEAVTLLTIHASKGLEFPHVMLIAAEEGSLPHIRKTSPTDFEEEKRLFYVAVTRARHQLDIVYTQKRAGEAREPSRFVADLPEAILPSNQDPNMASLQKKLHRRQQKARQATLF